MMWSSRSRNNTPHQNPMTAGAKASRPMLEDCSMAGISRLHTEAATMTPAAKPVRARCKDSLKVFFRKNTHAAPRVVPRKGIKIP